jgi:PHD/YefM family antitoxin component YafN of YafNO toxin-antitoxin module
MKITHVPSRQARDELADIMKRAHENGDVTVLTRYGSEYVAVVPMRVLEVAIRRNLQDQADLERARKRRARRQPLA